MACPLRIAVVAGSALIAFLALYLTFWQSEPDELEKDALEAESEDEAENETRKESVQVCCVCKCSCLRLYFCSSARRLVEVSDVVLVVLEFVLLGQTAASAYKISFAARNIAGGRVVSPALFSNKFAVDWCGPRGRSLCCLLPFQQ